MLKILRFIVLFILVLSYSSITYAQFPYLESFRNGTAPGITFGGSPSAFLTAAGSGYANGTHTGVPIDAQGDGFLRLTNAANDQKGYAISNTTFPSTDGLRVEFEYYIYGGSGADGISFFLYDATASPFNIGAYGGSLGYAQTTNPILTPGVSKGYLAIGLDEYGNFSNPNEGRQGGAPSPAFKPGSVTLRGKGDGNALVPDNYKWLATTQENTSTFPFGLVGNGAVRTSDPTNPGYRKVLMIMEPNVQGGYSITVKITKGGSPQVLATVIDRFYYSEAAPPQLRYGFASSTGYYTNFHEVRNVGISILPKVTILPPTANNDVATACQNTQAIINVAANDTSPNIGGEINKSSIDLDPTLAGIQTVFTVPTKGVFAVTSGGFVQFTQSTSFVGPVSCNYSIQDMGGATSNNATITVNYSEAPVMPNAGTDQLITVTNTPTSTTLQATNPNANTGIWTQVSGPTTALFVNPSSFTTSVSNLNGGVYVFRWTVKSAGGCELFDDVKVIINNKPVAVNDATTTNLNVNINIPILANDTDADGNTTIQNNSITIYSQPQNGTIIVDNFTGIVTYKPNLGFSGIDSFVYTVKDIYGSESNMATVTITVNPELNPAKVGLAKALTKTTKNIDGTYELSYTFTIVNPGEIAINNVSLKDNLALAFPGAAIKVKQLFAEGTLVINSAFNGTSDQEMLSSTSVLRPISKELVKLTITVALGDKGGEFKNTSFVTGISVKTGLSVDDQSTNGFNPDSRTAGDFTPNDPTPITLIKDGIFIPGGFSPNNDGINDVFVIENSSGKQLNLEIFNRWANRIYKAKSYQNNWDGKTTEGIHLGEDVPAGTYYYILTIDNKDKRVGYITINR